MSSKKKATAMEERGQPALVPKLRFPEFREAEGWKVTALNVIADPVTERAIQGEEDNVLSLSGEHGIVLQSEIFGKKVAGDNSERYLKIARNDFVYNDRTTKASTFGTIKRLSKYSGGIVSPIYKCFRFQGDENPVFWEWYFESGMHNKALAALVNEGARAGRFNISITQFLSTGAWRPGNGEQKKIAECLSSAEEVIAAQAGKLGALKAYKKGLMQQLFPREGETQPRLRFLEFQDSGGWVEGTLANACQMQAGKFVSASDIYEEREDGMFPCYGGNGLRGYTRSFTHTGKYPLIGRQGALCGNVKLATGKFHGTEHALIATPNRGVHVSWLFYALDFLNLNRFATGQAQPGLSVDVLEKVALSIPEQESEQQRIADCLSSLDDLIAAETQKLDALKAHKRGLTQQLFPSENVKAWATI
jgi:type I restriction enzyme S subunit